MLLKFLFNTTQVDDFAKSLARNFVQRFPPDLGSQPKKGADKMLAAAIRHLNEQALGFSREHKVGIYRKAKLSNTLKWELKEMGYQNDLIDEVIKGMLIAMARKK